jgi:hypothetical protein
MINPDEDRDYDADCTCDECTEIDGAVNRLKMARHWMEEVISQYNADSFYNDKLENALEELASWLDVPYDVKQLDK